MKKLVWLSFGSERLIGVGARGGEGRGMDVGVGWGGIGLTIELGLAGVVDDWLGGEMLGFVGLILDV